MEFLAFYIASFIATKATRVITNLSLCKDAADNGYKVDQEKLRETKSTYLDYLPGANLFGAFFDLAQYKLNPEQALYDYDIMGIINPMTRIEEQEYKKNPTGLNAILVEEKALKRIKNAPRLEVKDREGNPGEIVYEVNQDNIEILDTTGSASKMGIFRQRAEVEKLFEEEEKEEECDLSPLLDRISELSKLSDKELENLAKESKDKPKVYTKK